MQMMLVGLIIFVAGLIYKMRPPKEINRIYGWRTGFAKKNQDTWKEANKFGAILFICGGIFLMLAAYITGALYKNAGRYVFKPLVLVVVIAILIIGELRLRRIFDEEGNRKTKD